MNEKLGNLALAAANSLGNGTCRDEYPMGFALLMQIGGVMIVDKATTAQEAERAGIWLASALKHGHVAFMDGHQHRWDSSTDIEKKGYVLRLMGELVIEALEAADSQSSIVELRLAGLAATRDHSFWLLVVV